MTIVFARRHELIDRGRCRLAELHQRIGHPVGVGRPQYDLACNSSCDPELATSEMAQAVTQSIEQVVAAVATRLFDVCCGARSRDVRLEVDLSRRRLGGRQLLVHLGHAKLADAIGNDVVHDHIDRSSSALHALDRHEAPQGTSAIEGFVVQPRSQVEQLALGPIAG